MAADRTRKCRRRQPFASHLRHGRVCGRAGEIAGAGHGRGNARDDHANGDTPPERITARAQGDVERTRESDGKASAVHFFHFDFTPARIAAWQSGEGQAMLAIDHPEYGHAALFSADTRAFLAAQCFE